MQTLSILTGSGVPILDALKISSNVITNLPMKKALEDIVQSAKSHWDSQEVTIVHRVGKLLPKDVIVGVVVSSRHRSNAFKACEFIIDFLKTDAPFWKKEISDEGEIWVAERQEDVVKKTNWNKLD